MSRVGEGPEDPPKPRKSPETPRISRNPENLPKPRGSPYLGEKRREDPEDPPISRAGDVHEVHRGDGEGEAHPNAAKHSS